MKCESERLKAKVKVGKVNPSWQSEIKVGKVKSKVVNQKFLFLSSHTRYISPLMPWFEKGSESQNPTTGQTHDILYLPVLRRGKRLVTCEKWFSH
jgi:hypothetical protein